MTFVFGPFHLDQPARILRIEDREIPLQPRAFDLLVYLVCNRARVVAKDELLDALWPGVTVTENSLQRAASMVRTALREGGMEQAIRSFPRVGYRFCAGVTVHDPISSGPGEERADDRAGAVAAAERAVSEQRWNDAVALYEKTEAAGGLSGSDLGHWAFALQCLGRASDAIPVLTRSVAVHARAGDDVAAARNAAELARIHLERGEAALSKGWLARGEQLLGANIEAPESGLLQWVQSRIAAFDGDAQRALELAENTYALGQRACDPQVESLGLMYRGFYKLSLGDTQAGLNDQDHAAALALSSNVDPVTGGLLYCTILWACRTFGDWERANQWTLGYQEFCSSNHMEYSGACQLHRAEVLGVQGTLRDARAHVEDALAKLPIDAPWAMGDAYRVLGDIHAAIGDADAAMTCYDKAYSAGWDAQPGHAMLLLERGEAESAYAGLERSLIGQNWWTLQRQGTLLAHLALAAAHAGRHDRAQGLIDNLAGQSQRWPAASIRALINEASAVLAVAHGNLEDAIRHLHLARQLWTSTGSRFHAARVRLDIAERQLAYGDKAGATTEIRVARSAIEDLGSEKLRQRSRALQDRLNGASSADTATHVKSR